MDAKVTEDTAPVHWQLEKEQTKKFLAKLFPDEKLFLHSNVATNLNTPVVRNLKSLLCVMEEVLHRENGRWKWYPDLSKTEQCEEEVAAFLNDVIRHTPNSHLCTRQWTGKASNRPVDGLNGVNRKPDLLLCEEGIIKQRVAEKERFNMSTDVYALGEIKSKCSDEYYRKQNYIELAGKVALLLEVQDGRHATPCIQILDSRIIFTLFDRGGSISTYPLDIHQYPEEFLRILLGITFADANIFGFDSSISLAQDGQKKIRIVQQDKEHIILVDTLLFFSGTLHGRGTTVWSGAASFNAEAQEVVVKDTWVDPLRRYTEGRILKMLETAQVKGVPKLLHEQQVQSEHPVTRQILNNSTHTIRSLISTTRNNDPPYNLRVLSRMVSQPRGYPIFEFASLPELLVALIDCLCAHRGAHRIARILHRDISLFNLFLVLAKFSNLDVSFLDQVLRGPAHTRIQDKIRALPRRGLLGDWGYGIPTNDLSHSSDPVPGIRVAGQTKVFSRRDLCDTHSVVIPVADQPLPEDPSGSIDASPLQRTGTWAWMAAELSHIGPGKPVVHEAHHDLESFFYILLAICLLYDKPGRLKPAKTLAKSFDPFFAVSRPSTFKTVTVQSTFGWTASMLPFISSYFHPLIPLLEKVRREFILPLEWYGDTTRSTGSYTHDDFIKSIVITLSELPDNCWPPSEQQTNPSNAAVVPPSSSTSLPPTGPPPPPPTTFRMSGDSSLRHRVCPIRIGGSSSAGASKRRLESDGQSGSRRAKRRSPIGGDQSVTGTSGSHQAVSEISSSATSWANLNAE